MKARIFLKPPCDKTNWCYGLCRYENGVIAVSEILPGEGFHPVGASCNDAPDDSDDFLRYAKPVGKSIRDRRRIIKDLFVACYLELEAALKESEGEK